MISLSIDVTKIDKNLLITGKTRADGTTPKYLDIRLLENKNGVGQYGDSHFCVQGVSKAQREAGVKGPIIGNAKVQQDQPPQRQRGYTSEAERDAVNAAHKFKQGGGQSPFVDDTAGEIPFAKLSSRESQALG